MVHLAAVSNDATANKESKPVDGIDTKSLGPPDMQASDPSSSVYGSLWASRELPKHEMPEDEMPKEIAYRMIK